MSINIFGQKIEVPKINPDDEVNRIVDSLLKRKEEREIVLELLESQSVEDKQRKVELVEKVHLKAQQDKTVISKPVLTDFVVKKLKESHVGKHSLYENLVMRVIEGQGRFRVSDFARALRLGHVDARKAPFGFVGEHKEAENVLVGKISSDVDEETRQAYLAEKYLAVELREIAQDLFYAVNHGLDREQAKRYLGLSYELRRLFVRLPTNGVAVKENLVKAIRGEPIDLVHIKCARFTYPKGERLVIDDGLDQVIVQTKEGKEIISESQHALFEELRRVKKTFQLFGVNSRLVVLVNDQDLYDHFVEGDTIVSGEEIFQAKKIFCVFSRKIGSIPGVDRGLTLLEYLAEKRMIEQFYALRMTVIDDLKKERGIYPRVYVEGEVNNRYEFNQQIFAKPTNREYARERIYFELATMQALGIIDGRTNGRDENLLVIQKDMGNDSGFIGGYKQTALPVVFVNLSY